MKCPSCKMILCRIDYEGVPICTCPECKGEFVDLNRLRLIESRQVEKFGETAATRSEIAGVGTQRGKQLICPRCGSLMAKKRYRATDVIVDYCKSCHGIWLDDQELEKIQILAEQRNSMQTAMERRGSAMETALASARKAARSGVGSTTEGEGYLAIERGDEESLSIPALWLRLLVAVPLISLAIAWYSGLIHTLFPLHRLFERSTIEQADAYLPTFLAAVAVIYFTNYTRVRLKANEGLEITRRIMGIPLRRHYAKKDLAYIGTDYIEPGFVSKLLSLVFLSGRSYYYRYFHDVEPEGKRCLYVVSRNGGKILVYKGRSDSSIGQLCDLLQAGLGLRVKRL